MTSTYKALAHFSIEQTATLNRRSGDRATDVVLDDPATVVMTDLNDLMPWSISQTATINAANDKMIACGVRLLFVTDIIGNVQGLITSTDVLGEKPVQYLKEHGGTREDIIVQDIMTPHAKLDALHMKEVEHARVGDIVETMKALQRQHMLVTDMPEGSDSEVIRGIFSTTQMGRQLGYPVEAGERANSFAELEQALMAG